MKKYDFLLKNGHVIDPANGIDGVADVAVAQGKIAAVSANLNAAEAEKVIDVTGLYVTPGLVDAHLHCYYTSQIPKAWSGDYSIQPDYVCFPAGVTTCVDVGSSGSYNFDHFRATVINRSKLKIFALLNIADYGMSSLMVEQFPERNDYDSFIECAQRNADVIKGIKIAHYEGKDWRDLDYAKKVQKVFNKPIMVDFGVFKKERPYDELVMERLDPGDISTHCLRGPVPVIDENGKVYEYLWKARERGIRFDLGHGCGSYVMRNGIPAMAQGFLPDTFSTDLHALSINSYAISMTNVLSKMLACCDMPLSELFRRATIEPAKMLDLGDVGTLSVGSEADIAVFNMLEGKFGYQDNAGGRIEANRKIECEMTFRAGEIVWDINARAGTPWQELPKLYGFFPEKEAYVLPTRYV